MTIEVIDYRTWRKALHDKQIAIDTLDETFWSDPRIAEEDSWNDLYEQYQNDRAKLVQDLNDHYAIEPQIPTTSK